MRQLVLESAPTISTVRQQPREYGLSCHVRTQSQTSLVRCQLGSFLHLLYSPTLSHIPHPFRLRPSFSENLSPFTLLPSLSPPLIRIDFPHSWIPSLLLGLHSSHWIHTTPLLYSLCCWYHPPTHPYSRPVSFSHSSAICPCRFPGVQRTV